jgi:predicted ATP-dependent endonuclease of OLD family
MRLSKVQIKNFRSIKDSGDIEFNDNLFVLAGQNESGKSSILEALNAFEKNTSNRDSLNFELENQENFTQEISCTYTDLDDAFYNEVDNDLLEFVQELFPESEDLRIDNILTGELKSKITEFTLTRTFSFTGDILGSSIVLNQNTIGKIKSLVRKFDQGEVMVVVGSEEEHEVYLNVDSHVSDIAEIFWQNTPGLVLFNDFTTVLPDKILLEELEIKDVKGQVAVKNLEKLLKSSFAKIAQKNTPQKNSTAETESEALSANFQQDWQQKIFGNNKVNIKFIIENNDQGSKEISFYVETKDNEFLAPRKRSKGMIWFLSLWLELKAKENGKTMVLLFDEPGLHLHVKANKDMLSVFHKLIAKGHQIIYSTHSPSLIETNKLHNIGLVINHEKQGTLVEGLTTSKINTENKKDALQPIAEAMGMEPLKDFSVLKERNVLLEGLSDFWYFKGMKHLLNIDGNFEFIPGIGIKESKIYHLISFCIGYGLDWLLVMDGGEIPQKVFAELKDNLFTGNQDDITGKVLLIKDHEIENMFSTSDLMLIDATIKEDTKKTPIEIIGTKRKILFARLFFQKVILGDIKLHDIHPETVERFKKVFTWIEDRFAHNSAFVDKEAIQVN